MQLCVLIIEISYQSVDPWGIPALLRGQLRYRPPKRLAAYHARQSAFNQNPNGLGK